MKKRVLLTGFIFWTLMLCGFFPQAQDRDAEFMSVFHSISSHDLFAYAEELSSAKYKGRLSGTQEYMQAAEWVASHLKEWGIKPYGDNGTYFQMFDIPHSVIKSPGSLSLHVTDAAEGVLTIDYTFPQDYFPGTNSDTGEVTSDVVYVGHGITAPELNYDDYAGMDVRGKIVVIDPDVPFQGPDEEYIKWVPYSYHQFKLNNARSHGASGLLYIGKTANPNTSFNSGLIYCHIDEHVAEHLFFSTGREHKAVLAEIKKDLKPGSFALDKTVTLTAVTERMPQGPTCNVIGVIEGTDPDLKQEVIIVGGHLDGVGDLGLVMPGALDNASGVADILGAAKALAHSPVPLKRSVMFLFIGGEECGLLGSHLYCEQPKFPKDKSVVFFNLDMVGNGTGLSVGGGLTYPQIYRHFEAANQKYLHRTLRTSRSSTSVGRPRSDSVIFNRAGFRTMSFGTTGRVKKMYYHHPLDTAETLTPEIMEDVAKLMFVGLTALANDTELGFAKDGGSRKP